MEVQVIENVLKMNDEIAALNRRALNEAGVFTVDLIGAPGSGKTTLLEATVDRLRDLHIGIICGDPYTQRDADRIARHNTRVVQINTGKGCHLQANHVYQALQKLDLHRIDLLFIENVGNLICPVGFDLGQDVKVGIFAVSDGDDKPSKHPYLVTESRLMILAKIDLLPYVPFDLDLFRADVCRLNATAPLLEMSVLTGKGLGDWTRWIESNVAGRSGPEDQSHFGEDGAFLHQRCTHTAGGMP